MRQSPKSRTALPRIFQFRLLKQPMTFPHKSFVFNFSGQLLGLVGTSSNIVLLSNEDYNYNKNSNFIANVEKEGILIG